MAAMNSHNEMLLSGTNSDSSALPFHLPSPHLPSLPFAICHLPFRPSLPLCDSVNLTTNNKQLKTLPFPKWHDSCVISASMWKQGCLQYYRCPNTVHVPRHSPALRTRAHRPSPEPFNLQPQPPICPGDLQFTYKHLQKFPPPKADFRKLSKFSGKNFFFATATLQLTPWNPILPMQLTIMKVIESVRESVVKIRNTCRLAGYGILKVLKVFFHQRHPNPDNSLTLHPIWACFVSVCKCFCKCL
jgi:hypothetical protein